MHFVVRNHANILKNYATFIPNNLHNFVFQLFYYQYIQIQMDTNQNNNYKQFFKIIALFLLLFLLSSCDAITGIFKAGMGFGIFIVITVVVVIVGIVIKLGKK